MRRFSGGKIKFSGGRIRFSWGKIVFSGGKIGLVEVGRDGRLGSVDEG